ncbi:MAG: hypothetical protein Q8R79_05205 [Legionellaceae bacterium]|nr:hypothetical protein [Legionellaceae bacterium]
MRDMMLDALLPESMSNEAAYHLVNFIGYLARTLECIYHTQIRRHDRKVELEFYYSMSNVIMGDPPF